jgi:hypothetical protein
VGLVDRALVGAQQPPLGERGDPVHIGQQRERVATAPPRRRHTFCGIAGRRFTYSASRTTEVTLSGAPASSAAATSPATTVFSVGVAEEVGDAVAGDEAGQASVLGGPGTKVPVGVSMRNEFDKGAAAADGLCDEGGRPGGPKTWISLVYSVAQ